MHHPSPHCAHINFCGLHECSASVDECQWVPFFPQGGIKFYMFASYTLPCQTPLCQTAFLLPQYSAWRSPIVTYYQTDLTLSQRPWVWPKKRPFNWIWFRTAQVQVGPRRMAHKGKILCHQALNLIWWVIKTENKYIPSTGIARFKFSRIIFITLEGMGIVLFPLEPGLVWSGCGYVPFYDWCSLFVVPDWLFW